MATSVVPPVLASIGDNGVLNERLTPELSDVWIDRDLSWLAFNERMLAEAIRWTHSSVGTREIPGDLQLESRRVLHEARVRPARRRDRRSSLHGLLDYDRNFSPLLQKQAECYRSRDCSRSRASMESSLQMGRPDRCATREEASNPTSTKTFLPH